MVLGCRRSRWASAGQWIGQRGAVGSSRRSLQHGAAAGNRGNGGGLAQDSGAGGRRERNRVEATRSGGRELLWGSQGGGGHGSSYFGEVEVAGGSGPARSSGVLSSWWLTVCWYLLVTGEDACRKVRRPGERIRATRSSCAAREPTSW